MIDADTTPPELEELVPLFPSYEFVSLIGVGGMGTVYKAVQVSLEREVAIKLLPKKFGENPEFLMMFEEEAKSMAKMNHPNLLSVIDFGEAGGMPFIVMEYVNGSSLHEAVGGQSVESVQACEIILQVAEAIAHVHNTGVLHRDIKPANIMIDQNFLIKVADFGLATSLHEDSNEGMVWGTPGFTAPEVMQRLQKASAQADIYSIGAVLYTLLTGETPALSNVSFLHCDPKFVNILQKAMSENPGRRYVSANDLVADLKALLKLLKPKAGKSALVTAGGAILATPSNPLSTGGGILSAPARAPSALPPVGMKVKQSGGGYGVLIVFLIIAVAVAGALFLGVFDPQGNENDENNDLVGDYTPKQINLPNSSFEEFKKSGKGGAKNKVFEFTGWKSKRLSRKFHVMPVQPEGRVGEHALSLTEGMIKASSEIYVEKGNTYELEFLIARKAENFLVPGKDFKINLTIGNLIIAKYEDTAQFPSIAKGESMARYVIRFNAEHASNYYANGRLGVRFICDACELYIDDLKFRHHPIRPKDK